MATSFFLYLLPTQLRTRTSNFQSYEGDDARSPVQRHLVLHRRDPEQGGAVSQSHDQAGSVNVSENSRLKKPSA